MVCLLLVRVNSPRNEERPTREGEPVSWLHFLLRVVLSASELLEARVT